VLRLYQRAIIGLARGFGYVPTGPVWVHRLQSLHGDFRRSRWDRWTRYVIEGIGLAGGAWTLGFSVQRYLRIPSGTDLILGAMALTLLTLFVVLVMRNGVWYHFDRGAVSAYRAGGALLWKEDLNGLTRIVCTRGRSSAFLRLHWPDRTRRMELYDSLEAALSAPPK
jgi:hypothetical protein